MRRIAGLLLGVAVAAMTGCSANNTTSPEGSGASTEQQQVQEAIVNAPELANDGMFDSGESTTFGARGAVGPLTGTPGEESPPSDPPSSGPDRRFWRTIVSVERSFDIEFSETGRDGRPLAAHVVVHRRLAGEFHVVWTEEVAAEDGSVTTVTHTSTKPLHDHWVRHLWLARRPHTESNEREWHLVAASGVEVASVEEGESVAPHIQSVRLQYGDQDATFTDPAAAIRWADLLRVPSGTDVTVTVTTDAADDVVVLMRAGARTGLAPNGDNTYSGTWSTPSVTGLKHFGVNALSRATVYDAEGGYHSDAWFYPYLNRDEAITESMQ